MKETENARLRAMSDIQSCSLSLSVSSASGVGGCSRRNSNGSGTPVDKGGSSNAASETPEEPQRVMTIEDNVANVHTSDASRKRRMSVASNGIATVPARERSTRVRKPNVPWTPTQ